MAMGAGGFGWLGAPRLFGQCLIVSRDLYNAGGGHKAVSKTILENLALSSCFERVGGRFICNGGRGVLNVRMFPDGFGQLCKGWKKAFADGAAASGAAVLLVSIFWLTSMCTCFLALLLTHSLWRIDFAVLYILFAIQLLFLPGKSGILVLSLPTVSSAPVLLLCTLRALSLSQALSQRRELARQDAMRSAVWTANLLGWPILQIAIARLTLSLPLEMFAGDRLFMRFTPGNAVGGYIRYSRSNGGRRCYRTEARG